MLMILAFTIDPAFIYNFQDTLLGKAIVALTLIYLTMNSVTLGLLFTLAIILVSSRFDKNVIEGLKNKQQNTSKKITMPNITAVKNTQTGQTTTSKMTTIEPKCKTLEELLREKRNANINNAIAAVQNKKKGTKNKKFAGPRRFQKKFANIKAKALKIKPKPTNKYITDEVDDEEIDDEIDDEIEGFDTYDLSLDYANADSESDNEDGVDRIALEETFRVRNPSTIPVTRESFSVKKLAPFDNVSKYYGGTCSLI